VHFGGIYVSGTPIWSRIGEKSVLGHPFPQENLKYAGILLGFVFFVGLCLLFVKFVVRGEGVLELFNTRDAIKKVVRLYISIVEFANDQHHLNYASNNTATTNPPEEPEPCASHCSHV